MMTNSTPRTILAGDKVVRDAASQDQGMVRLGDSAPAFVRAGDKVRDAATQDPSKVRLGDSAPVFAPRAGDKVVRDAATQDQSKVRLGDSAPVFTR
jgi:hypothetical protein